MELRRAVAQFVRDHPALWDLFHPTYDRLRRRVRNARIKRLFSDRMAPSDEAGHALLAEAMARGGPLGVGKIGGLEGEAAGFFLGPRRKGEPYPKRLRAQMFLNVGIFPADDESLDRFCEALVAAASEMDILGVMGFPGEPEVLQRHATRARLVPPISLDPWYYDPPWSSHLAGRRVTVVSPFARTIQGQYARREEIWPGRAVLPAFELRTVAMPLSPGLVPAAEKDWQERLARVTAEVESAPYDVLIVGAGGLSLLLAAHARRMGRIGFHMGGPTQILFGVRGRRWDEKPFFQAAATPAWTRPSGDEAPPTAGSVERGCYW